MWRTATLGLFVVVLAVGCASGTKSGGTVAHPIKLVMQAADGTDTDTNSSYFVSQVNKRSGGRIQITIGTAYPSSDARNEPRLVRALRSGKVQMAYIPARAWEEASPVQAFRALQAPLLVTNYRLLREITTGPIGRSMLASLSSTGVVGLGLVPQRLRRLFGRTPLDSADTLHDARIRPVTSPTGEMALRALGAVPVTIASAREAGPAMAARKIEGVESETISIANNGYTSYAHYLTANLALFAKASTIAIRRSVFERLSAQERSILRAAAKATVAHADPAAAEQTDMATLCSQGVRLVTASRADLASLEPLAQRAYPTLERDPTTRRDVQAIERLKKTGPNTISDVPACPSARASQPRSHGGGPAGTYTLSASLSEIGKAAGDHGTVDNYGSFHLDLGNGHFRISDRRPAAEKPLVQGGSSGFSTGTYSIQSDRISFTVQAASGDTPLGAPGDQPVICRWSLDRHALTFRQLPPKSAATASAQGLDAAGPPFLFVKPWRQAAPATQPAKVFPTGTFETKITPADVRGVSGLAWWAHWETLTFTKNGTFVDVWFHPRRPDQPTVRGRYFARGNRMYQIYGPGRKDSYRWSYNRGTLTMQPLSHPDLDKLGMLIYSAHSWRKIK